MFIQISLMYEHDIRALTFYDLAAGDESDTARKRKLIFFNIELIHSNVIYIL